MRKYTIFGLSRSSEKAIHEACFASVGNQRVQKISRVIACIFKRGITVPRRRGRDEIASDDPPSRVHVNVLRFTIIVIIIN